MALEGMGAEGKVGKKVSMMVLSSDLLPAVPSLLTSPSAYLRLPSLP